MLYNKTSYQQKVVEGKIVYISYTSANPVYLVNTKNGKLYLYANHSDCCQNLSFGDTVVLLCDIKNISFRDKQGMVIYYTFGVDKVGYINEVITRHISNNLVYKIINFMYSISLVIREYIITTVRNNISAPMYNVILRLTLGYTDSELKDVKNYFQDAGVAHVLVVSGLHIGFVYIFVSFLVKLVCSNISLRKIVSMIITILFMFITGCTPPVVRATVIICFISISQLLQRKHSNIHALLFAAMIILVVAPMNLFNGSFQLTFAACFGILSIYNFLYTCVKPLIEQTNKILQSVVKLFITTFSAQVMVIPLIMYYFNKISIISFISNIFVIPLTSVLLWLSLVYYILNFLFGSICPILWQILQTFTSVYIELVKFFAMIPFGSFNVPTPDVYRIVVYYILIFLILFVLKLRNILYFAGVVLAAILFLCVNLYTNNKFNLTFLDVGLGDSILITTQDRKVILVDTADSENTAKYKIVPFLYKNKIKNIDYLIITHFHYPHYGGAKYIINNFNVKNLFIPNFFPQEYNEYKDIISSAHSRKVNLVVVHSTISVQVCNGEIELIPNFISHATNEVLLTDYNSIMLNIKYKNYVVILSNDIPSKFGITKLLNYKQDKYVVFQLPRHGKYFEDLDILRLFQQAKNKILFTVVSTDKIKLDKNLIKFPVFSTSEYGGIRIDFDEYYRINSINFEKDLMRISI